MRTEHVQSSSSINEEALALRIPYMGVEFIDFWSGTNHIKEREREERRGGVRDDVYLLIQGIFAE